jgi:hypothetical protein
MAQTTVSVVSKADWARMQGNIRMARHLWSSWCPGSADSLVITYVLMRLEPILQRKPFKP